MTAFIIVAHSIAVPITSHTMPMVFKDCIRDCGDRNCDCERHSVFYDQICDCEYNNRKESMLKMVTIFTMVNSLEEYSCKHTPVQFSITFCDDICKIKCNYLGL